MTSRGNIILILIFSSSVAIWQIIEQLVRSFISGVKISISYSSKLLTGVNRWQWITNPNLLIYKINYSYLLYCLFFTFKVLRIEIYVYKNVFIKIIIFTYVQRHLLDIFRNKHLSILSSCHKMVSLKNC